MCSSMSSQMGVVPLPEMEGNECPSTRIVSICPVYKFQSVSIWHVELGQDRIPREAMPIVSACRRPRRRRGPKDIMDHRDCLMMDYNNLRTRQSRWIYVFDGSATSHLFQLPRTLNVVLKSSVKDQQLLVRLTCIGPI